MSTTTTTTTEYINPQLVVLDFKLDQPTTYAQLTKKTIEVYVPHGSYKRNNCIDLELNTNVKNVIDKFKEVLKEYFDPTFPIIIDELATVVNSEIITKISFSAVLENDVVTAYCVLHNTDDEEMFDNHYKHVDEMRTEITKPSCTKSEAEGILRMIVAAEKALRQVQPNTEEEKPVAIESSEALCLKDFEEEHQEEPKEETKEEHQEEPKEETKEERPDFMEFMKAEGYDEDTLIDDITLKIMQMSYLLKYIYNLSDDDDELPPKTVPQKQVESEEIKEEPEEEPEEETKEETKEEVEKDDHEEFKKFYRVGVTKNQMNPEPLLLDYFLDTSIKAVELPKKDVTIRVRENYQYTRQDCVDIYKAFPKQVYQLRKSLDIYYPNLKNSPLEIDLLNTQIFSTEITCISFDIIHQRNGNYKVSAHLHNYAFDDLLKERLVKREEMYELLNNDTNTTDEVTFWLLEISDIETTIKNMYKQQKH